MANFNFTLNFSKPKVKVNKKPNRQIIKRDVTGVIGITLEASYFIEIDGQRYPLTLESYNVKGKKIYYADELIDNKVFTVMRLDKRRMNSKVYLPFHCGAIVKGSTYMIHGLERFNLKKVIDKSEITQEEFVKYNNLSHKFLTFYRENYKQIRCTD